jgi:hypothetical protein
MHYSDNTSFKHTVGLLTAESLSDTTHATWTYIFGNKLSVLMIIYGMNMQQVTISLNLVVEQTVETCL